MGIIDAVIIILLIVGILDGIRKGAIKSAVGVVGLVIVLCLSFALKNPIARFFYRYLPFFEIKGVFEGLSVVNILIYELIAFLIVFAVLYTVLKIILKVTGLVETILNATIVLGAVSKLLGAALGFIYSYVIIFIILFFLNSSTVDINLQDSKIATFMLNKTPVLSSQVKGTVKSIDELRSINESYKKNKNVIKYNREALKLFMEYGIIDEKSVDILRQKKKINY